MQENNTSVRTKSFDSFDLFKFIVSFVVMIVHTRIFTVIITKMRHTEAIKKYTLLILCLFVLSVFSGVFAEEYAQRSITVEYSGAEPENQTITVDYSDDWLLQPDDIYNHKLMQASFALAAAGFRDKSRDLSQKDYNILDFFAQAGFIEPRTIDFDVTPSIDTIGTAIAHKYAGDAILIAVSISGNNYQGEWAGNLTIDDDNRVKGFNDAAYRVMNRLEKYIRDYDLSGDLRLWVAGYSRSAAVTNDFAADATESGLFQAVYAYTFATPRTTKETDVDKYHNIFNLINPFDIVPMSPFPEWGFTRYGIDLYFPSMETDSNWFGLQAEALRVFESVSDEEIIINPQMNKDLHMVFDYLAFFVNSANSYKTTYQNLLVNFVKNRDFGTLLNDLSEQISFSAIRDYLKLRDKIVRYQMHEVYNFLDYISQLIYTGFIAQRSQLSDDFGWNPRYSAQENIAFNHYDKTYRSWLFSNNDPDALLLPEPEYTHVVIQGDVDVDVFDESGDFVIHINNNNSLSYTSDEVRMPSFTGGISQMLIYADRQGKQTLIVLPLDQVFTVGIYSHKKQDIRVSYTEYSADKLHADVRYIYYDTYDTGEYYSEVFDPEKERYYTAEDLQNMGVLVVEPWSGDIVYSPTAIMRLENSGISHPSPIILVLFVMLGLGLLVFIFIGIMIVIFRIFKRILQRPSRELNTRDI